MRGVSTQVNQKGRPSGKTSPRGRNGLFIPRLSDDNAQCMSASPPLSPLFRELKVRVDEFGLWRIIFTLISSRQMSPKGKRANVKRSEEVVATVSGCRMIRWKSSRLYTLKNTIRECGNKWGKIRSLSFIPFMLTNEWSLEYDRIKLSPKLNRIRINRCFTRAHCKLSITYGHNLSLFSILLFIFVTTSNFPGRDTIIS